MDAANKVRARFAVTLLADALAPSNTLLANPAVLKKLIDDAQAAPRGPHRTAAGALRATHPIYWLETFVEPQRLRGTCYLAANWIELR